MRVAAQILNAGGSAAISCGGCFGGRTLFFFHQPLPVNFLQGFAQLLDTFFKDFFELLGSFLERLPQGPLLALNETPTVPPTFEQALSSPGTQAEAESITNGRVRTYVLPSPCKSPV